MIGVIKRNTQKNLPTHPHFFILFIIAYNLIKCYNGKRGNNHRLDDNRQSS